MLGAVLTSRKPESKSEIQAAVTAGLRRKEREFLFFPFSSSNIFHRPVRVKVPALFDERTKTLGSWQLVRQACVSACVWVCECAKSVRLTDN